MFADDSWAAYFGARRASGDPRAESELRDEWVARFQLD